MGEGDKTCSVHSVCPQLSSVSHFIENVQKKKREKNPGKFHFLFPFRNLSPLKTDADRTREHDERIFSLFTSPGSSDGEFYLSIKPTGFRSERQNFRWLLLFQNWRYSGFMHQRATFYFNKSSATKVKTSSIVLSVDDEVLLLGFSLSRQFYLHFRRKTVLE